MYGGSYCAFSGIMLIYMIQMAYQPIIIAMNFEYAEKGCSINFGLARGLGSVGFAVYSPILGTLLEHHSVSVIHIGDALVLTVGLLFLLTFKLSDKSEVPALLDEEKAKGEGTEKRAADHEQEQAT